MHQIWELPFYMAVGDKRKNILKKKLLAFGKSCGVMLASKDSTLQLQAWCLILTKTLRCFFLLEEGLETSSFAGIQHSSGTDLPRGLVGCLTQPARAELWESCEAAPFQLTCVAGRLLTSALSPASMGSLDAP